MRDHARKGMSAGRQTGRNRTVGRTGQGMIRKNIIQLGLVKTVRGQSINDGGMTRVCNEREVNKCYFSRAGGG